MSSTLASGVLNYKIDPVSSRVRDAVRHFGIAFSRGEFSEVDGPVTIDRTDLTKTAITAI